MHMVEIIKSAPELVQALVPLADIVDALTIAHSKRTATIYGTAEPLFGCLFLKMSPGRHQDGYLEGPGRMAEAVL